MANVIAVINSFVSIKISLTNLVFKLIIQKNILTHMRVIQNDNKLAAIYEKVLYM